MQPQPNRRDDDVAATSQDPISTLSPAAVRCAQWGMLNELSSMLKLARMEVNDLRDQAGATLEEGYDARAHIKYILNTVEVLDALGWRHAIQTEEDLAKLTAQWRKDKQDKGGKS